MKQMEARGVRSGGLSHRPEDERIVQINRYISTMPKTFGLFKSPYQTPDELIYGIAQNKEKQNQLLYDKLKRAQHYQEKGAKEMSFGLLKVAKEEEEKKKKDDKGGSGWLWGGGAIGANVGLHNGSRYGQKKGLSLATTKVLMDADDYVKRHNIPPEIESEMVQYFKRGVKDGTIPEKLKKMPEYYNTHAKQALKGLAIGTGTGVATGAFIRNQQNKKDEQKKEANEMNHGLIKVAEEKEEKKKSNAGLIGAGIGAKVGGSAGALAMKNTADKKGLSNARREAWDKGLNDVKSGMNPKQVSEMNKVIGGNLHDTANLKKTKTFKNTRNKYMVGAAAAGSLAGAASGLLAGKGVEKAKEHKKEANKRNHGLIKIAEENKQKDMKEPSLAKHLTGGAALGSAIGGAQMYLKR
jgi:hypothetical protein